MNTAIAFLIFKRPDTTEQVFNAIRQVKPSKLLVIADGPRHHCLGEAEKCTETRAIIDQVDWDCEVIKNYSEVNLGCGKRVASGLDWVFDQVEEAIILEDDCVPHPTFFRFCDDLLEQYRHNHRIGSISAQGFAKGHHREDYSYYFSRYPHSWGWATWRRAWQLFDFEISHWPIVHQQQRLKDILQDPRAVEEWTHTFQDMYIKGESVWDYRWLFSCWLHDLLSIHPRCNLVTNIGSGVDATHTKQSKFLNLPCEPMEFPLHHPPFITRETQADTYLQKTVFSWNNLDLAKHKVKNTLKIIDNLSTS